MQGQGCKLHLPPEVCPAITELIRSLACARISVGKTKYIRSVGRRTAPESTLHRPFGGDGGTDGGTTSVASNSIGATTGKLEGPVGECEGGGRREWQKEGEGRGKLD